MVITKDLGAVSAYAYAVEQGYQGTEEEFAELMARQATVAEEAAASADAAAESANEAQASAEQAEQSAQSISGDVERAEQAATTATGKATEAATSATTANGAAQTATGKAAQAEQSATAAANSASAAATSASNAAASATAAQTAQTVAETAQGKAEDAQAAAEAAAQSVSESAAQIAKNTSTLAEVSQFESHDVTWEQGNAYRSSNSGTIVFTSSDTKCRLVELIDSRWTSIKAKDGYEVVWYACTKSGNTYTPVYYVSTHTDSVDLTEYIGLYGILIAMKASGENINPTEAKNNIVLSSNIYDKIVDLEIGLAEEENKYYQKNYVVAETNSDGKYLNTANGELSNSSTYFTTDFIPVIAGKTYYAKDVMRFVCGYKADRTYDTSAYDANKYSYTIPSGISFIRVTGYTSAESTYIITEGSAPAEYAPHGLEIKSEYLPTIPVLISTGGGGRMTASIASLTSGENITLDDFPKNLKKGVALSFYAKFSSFTKLCIGKGYDTYRGDWIEIDGTNVVWKKYEESEVVKTTTAHGLTISDFIIVSLDVDSTNSATCHISIATNGGSIALDSEWQHEQNGIPFAFGSQNMTDVELSAVASDVKCPMWLFGDSYFGAFSNRVFGQLIDIGYAENVLVDGLAGQQPSQAILEVQKLIALGGIPKFLVWTLGMNGDSSAYSSALATLVSLANKYKFTLILYKVPTVPTRTANNNAVNTMVENSGYRFIDAFKAVGANTSGVWYTDYLSSDGVHPTALGARAIAMRILVDVPEIMQYGYNPKDIDGNAVGDL